MYAANIKVKDTPAPPQNLNLKIMRRAKPDAPVIICKSTSSSPSNHQGSENSSHSKVELANDNNIVRSPSSDLNIGDEERTLQERQEEYAAMRAKIFNQAVIIFFFFKDLFCRDIVAFVRVRNPPHLLHDQSKKSLRKNQPRGF